MKIDSMISFDNLAKAGSSAAELESVGYSGGWTIETTHDPFLPLAVAAPQTTTLELGTSIAVAFARNPMLLANIGWDLQTLSGGRFVMGLGSQIKPHITKRFSMEWSKPAARMREMIMAVRAIWDTWLNGSQLEFRGEFYRHTLMTPFFSPNPDQLAEVGLPRIMLAGVGPLMTRTAGEVADGFFSHGFSTEKFLREVTLPTLTEGRRRVGKTLEGFEITAPGFVVTGSNEQEMEAAVVGTRKQIAFYGSTPAYKPVLDIHGWGDLQPELNTLSKRGEWDTMGDLITDEILETFAIVAEPEQVAAKLDERYGDIATRVSFYAPYKSDPDRWTAVMNDIKAL